MARVLPLHLRLSPESTGDTGLYVLTQPGPRGPAHFLVCAIDGEVGSPLEESAPLQPALSPAVVPDDHGVLAELLEGATLRAPDYEGEDGRRVWKLDPEATRRARSILEEVPIRPLASAEGGKGVFAVAPLSEPGLRFTPIHRGITGLPSFHPETFLTVVKDYARIYDLDAPLTTAEGVAKAREKLRTMVRGQHAVLLVLPGGGGKLLRFRQALELSTFKAVPKSTTLRSLDLTLLNALVFQTALGLQPERAAAEGKILPVYGLESLVAQVNNGQLQAGFALNPPPLWEIRAVIEAGQALPPLTFQLGPTPELPAPSALA